MDFTAALLAGLAAGLAIAMQFGAVSLLLVEAAIAAGPRSGVAAGMGVATADLAFAAVAAAAGGAAGAALAGHEQEIRLVAAIVLAAIALHGLIGMRSAGAVAGAHAAIPDEVPGATGGVAGASGDKAAGRGAARDAPDRPSAGGHYGRFLALTTANPLTIASFAAVAASLSLHGLTAAAAFAGGVGVASAGWHALLTLAAGHAGRWLTPGARRGLAVGGRLAVLGIAAHLALAV